MKVYDFRTPLSQLTLKTAAFFALFLAFSLPSCKDDDGISSDELFYDQGVFITHEGPFQQGTGTINFYDKVRDTLHRDIFEAQNEGRVLGNIVQSMYIHNDRAYVVVNNANKIEVADATTFKHIGTIEGLALPRKIIAVSPDRAFVCQWGTNGVNGSIAVVDLEDLKVLSTIPCGSGPEDMLLHNGKVYIANSGGFGNDSTMVVIDVSDEAIESTVVVGDNPTAIEMDASENLWILCRGFSDFSDPNNNREGSLAQLSGLDITKSYEVPNGSNNLVIDGPGDNLYFLSPSGVLKHRIVGTVVPTTLLILGFYYGLGYDTTADELYVADAKDFQSPGQVIRFDTAGNVIDTLDAGIIPGSFWFN